MKLPSLFRLPVGKPALINARGAHGLLDMQAVLAVAQHPGGEEGYAIAARVGRHRLPL